MAKQTCAEKMHYNYIKYVEGVAMFLQFASERDNGEDTVRIKKTELKRLADTLIQTKTY